MRAHPGLWFGWNGQTTSHPVGPTMLRRDGITYASISYDAQEYRDFYLGFCNTTLWPLLHSFAEALPYRATQYAAYKRMNQRYARELAPLLQPDDLIWVHDYHLLELGQELRKAGCRQPSGLFLHTPFPTPDVLSALPGYRQLLLAMLTYDLVGFQTEADEDAFRRAVAEPLGHEALASTGVFPIGVDIDAIQREAALNVPLPGRKLILGIDRLDYTKGIVERVHAYDRFLDEHPARRKQVSFLQIAAPTRTEVPAYRYAGRSLEEAIEHTNARFGQPDWTPVRYVNQIFAHDHLLGLMRSADVGLVTPLRDGMNLVAKEFVAAQDPADPGVLILSTFAGAARELTSAVLVDPHDLAGTAAVIEQALSMPIAERRERHQAMLHVLRQNSLQAWHTRFVESLARTGV